MCFCHLPAVLPKKSSERSGQESLAACPNKSEIMAAPNLNNAEKSQSKAELLRARMEKAELQEKQKRLTTMIKDYPVLLDPLLEQADALMSKFGLHTATKRAQPSKVQRKGMKTQVDLHALANSFKERQCHRQHKNIRGLPVEWLTDLLMWVEPHYTASALKALTTWGASKASKDTLSAVLEFLTSVWRDTSITTWETCWDLAQALRADYVRNGMRFSALPLPPVWHKDGHYLLQPADCPQSVRVAHRLSGLSVTLDLRDHEFQCTEVDEVCDNWSEYKAYIKDRKSKEMIELHPLFRANLKKRLLAIADGPMVGHVVPVTPPPKKRMLALADGSAEPPARIMNPNDDLPQLQPQALAFDDIGPAVAENGMPSENPKGKDEENKQEDHPDQSEPESQEGHDNHNVRAEPNED